MSCLVLVCVQYDNVECGQIHAVQSMSVAWWCWCGWLVAGWWGPGPRTTQPLLKVGLQNQSVLSLGSGHSDTATSDHHCPLHTPENIQSQNRTKCSTKPQSVSTGWSDHWSSSVCIISDLCPSVSSLQSRHQKKIYSPARHWLPAHGDHLASKVSTDTFPGTENRGSVAFPRPRYSLIIIS